MALRDEPPGRDEGLLLRPRRLVVRLRADVDAALRPRPGARPGHLAGVPAVPGVGRAVEAPAAAGGWAVEHVLGGGADRVFLGQPGPGGPAPPRRLLDQLGVPRHRAPDVQDAG